MKKKYISSRAIMVGSLLTLVSVFGCSSERPAEDTKIDDIAVMKAELEKMRDEVQEDRRNLARERSDLSADRQALVQEQGDLKTEREVLDRERENAQAEPNIPNQFRRHAGDEFSLEVSVKGGGKRTVGIDADTMVAVTLKDGAIVLAPTVAFISNFDILDSSALAGLSSNQRQLIEQAGKNMSMDRSQVAFMLEHIKTAHGVEYDDVRAAAKECEKYFPELTR